MDSIVDKMNDVRFLVEYKDLLFWGAVCGFLSLIFQVIGFLGRCVTAFKRGLKG